MFNECLYNIKTWLNFMTNVLDQYKPKSKYQCKNELIYMADFLNPIKKRAVMYYQV